MRDLSFCERPVPGGVLRMEAHDPRFLRVSDLAQATKFTEAADAVAALVEEGAFDVRLLGYYLFAVVREEGLGRLPDVFGALVAHVKTNWEALPAGDKQRAYLDKTLTWLFKAMLDALEYHQRKADAQWEAWTRKLAEEQVSLAAEHALALSPLLPEPTFHTSAELLVALVRWLRALKVEVANATKQDAPPAPPAMSQPVPAPAAARPNEQGPFLQLGQSMQLRGSAALVELCNKLKAFEMLVERRDFEKAALVGDDIVHVIENFDPRRYFPELFASFGALLSRNVQEIRPYWARKDSVEWKMLEQFYQVDLAHFVGQGQK